MATYNRLMSRSIRKPIPAHALTPGAEAARETMRRLGHEKRMRLRLARLVTKHGRPKVKPHDGPLITPAARGLAKLAEAEGFRVEVVETIVGCSVVALHAERRVGFRAHWERGVSRGATWHSGGRDHFALVDITDRPIGVDAIAKTTKVKHRHDEGDRHRLVLVESPRGVHCNVTELRKKIRA